MLNFVIDCVNDFIHVSSVFDKFLFLFLFYFSMVLFCFFYCLCRSLVKNLGLYMLLGLVVLLLGFLVVEHEVANFTFMELLLRLFLTLRHRSSLFLLLLSLCNLERKSFGLDLHMHIVIGIFSKNILRLQRLFWLSIHSSDFRKLILEKKRRIKVVTWRSNTWLLCTDEL